MAGAGYKLFNSGDVLTAAQVNTYLQEQAVMRFANAAARTTALSGVLAEGMMSYLDDTNAVEVYNGSAWVSISADQTPLTTKGDLFTYTTTDARLGVGNNGETLLADSATSTGLRWGNNLGFTAGKNKFINGDFGINQRLFTSTTSGSFVYTFDRWGFAASGGTYTATAETFALGTAPIIGYEGKNYLKCVVTVGNDFCRLIQRIESVRTFANQTVTLSFWAKGVNPSGLGYIQARLQQYFGAGGSSSVDLTPQNVVLTSNWTRYSLTFSVPSIAGKTIGTAGDDYLAVDIGQMASTSTDGWTLEIWGVQLEAGSVATAFQTATGTLQGELAACQRYLPAFRGEYSPLNGWFTSTTGGNWVYNFAVPARVAPTGITVSAASDFQLINKTIAAVSPTAITWNYGGISSASVTTTHTAGSPTSAQGEVGFLRASTSSAYILFTGCEL